MDNLFTLAAQIAECRELRYTPAGIPILDIMLVHESWQWENGQQCLVKLEMPARIIGKDALNWQHREQTAVEVSGFLTQKSRCYSKPVLRIQNIKEYKG
ncbi:primosomal replication protein N [Neisseria musculi]|uniref:primosomal replication protein N n=1 Tax=Neisseria musculi TaxID=1815583 RepID=UPI00164AB405|nr:primosomal replication protein N [Neisseria musculi]